MARQARAPRRSHSVADCMTIGTRACAVQPPSPPHALSARALPADADTNTKGTDAYRKFLFAFLILLALHLLDIGVATRGLAGNALPCKINRQARSIFPESLEEGLYLFGAGRILRHCSAVGHHFSDHIIEFVRIAERYYRAFRHEVDAWMDALDEFAERERARATS